MPSAIVGQADHRTLIEANGTLSNGVSYRVFSSSIVLGGAWGIKFKIFNITKGSWRVLILLGDASSAARSSPGLLLANFFIVLDVSSGHG